MSLLQTFRISHLEKVCGCVSWMLDAAAESCVTSQAAGLAVAARSWGGQVPALVCHAGCLYREKAAPAEPGCGQWRGLALHSGSSNHRETL